MILSARNQIRRDNIPGVGGGLPAAPVKIRKLTAIRFVTNLVLAVWQRYSFARRTFTSTPTEVRTREYR